MADPVIRALFAALVERAGGVDVVALLMEARWGTGHKGTVSKMCAGHIGVTVDAVIVVEDALQVTTITDRMAARRGGATEGPVFRHAAGMGDLAADSAEAAGALQAVLTRALDARSPGGAALTPDERAAIAAKAAWLRGLVGNIISTAEAP